MVKTSAQIPVTNEQWDRSRTLESDSGQGPSSFFLSSTGKRSLIVLFVSVPAHTLAFILVAQK